nr:ABC transporter ATP-binding protein [Pseudidiomarina sp. 1APP75-27a]
MDQEPLIQLRGITKSYAAGEHHFLALKGIDLDIHCNELVAITGPSGSGKSTLMNVLGCLAKVDSGTYKLAGNFIGEASDDELAEYRNRSIGFIFQSFNLFPKLTVLDNVIYPLKFQLMSASERKSRAIKVLGEVGLADKLENFPGQLSGGQKQRVAIARALVTRPDILLGDEPTGNLDSETTAEIMGLFHALHSDGQTIILVTHEQDIATQCQRELRLVDGKVVKDDIWIRKPPSEPHLGQSNMIGVEL